LIRGDLTFHVSLKDDHMQLENKVALVTGGAHRVGGAITLMLARAGVDVIVNYHSAAEEAEETTALARSLGVEALAIRCDVGDWPAVQDMAEQVRARFGGVDIIVNSASLFATTPFPSDDVAVWRRVRAVTLDGAYYVCNSLVPSMQERGGGVIINIADNCIWRPYPNFLAHTASKAGLLAMTRALAMELAPAIRVNAVAPGPVLPPDRLRPESRQAIAERTLLKRWGKSDDVAQAVHYLLEADFVTGEVLRVDGGELLTR